MALVPLPKFEPVYGSARDGRHSSEFADYSCGHIRAVGLVWKPQGSTEFPNDPGFVSVGVWELANAASLASAGLLLFLVLTMVEAQRIKMGSKKRWWVRQLFNAIPLDASEPPCNRPETHVITLA